MRKPRRLLPVLVGAFALILGGTAWRLLSVPASPSVALIFLGYTNALVPVKAAAYRVSFPAALVQVTNTGRVPVEIMAAVSPKNFVQDGRTIRPTYEVCSVRNLQSPQFLNPGESIVMEVSPPTGATSWQVEIAYHIRSTQKQMLRQASKVSNPTARRWIDKVYQSPEIFWVDLGPFKDLPPTVVPEIEAQKSPRPHLMKMVGPPPTNWVWLSTPAKTNQVPPALPPSSFGGGMKLH